MSRLRASIRVTLGTLQLAVDLDVGGGEVVAVVGPNGAGKTTLLRALAGLVPIDAGHVDIGDETLENTDRGVRVPPAGRGIGMVFQDHLLFPHLSAADNVAFGLRARGMPAAAARQEAKTWIERVGVAAVADAMPAALSGGQAQRVAVARALAIRPSMLLLDEPLAALDVQARLNLRRDLRAHLNDFCGPCLVVTHDPLEAMALATRMIVIEGGRVVQDGSVADVTQLPRSAWVAALFGLNLYRGAAQGRLLRVAGQELATARAASGETFAAVHPRAVTLARTPPERPSSNVWKGHVSGLDVLGDRLRVHVEGPLPVVAEVPAPEAVALDLGVGGTVWASIDPAAVRTYPA